MYKKAFSLTFIIFFLNLFVCPINLAEEVILENGTRVRLKLTDKISSSLNNEGDEVNFLVMDDIKIGDTVLIKEGTRARGFIAELLTKGKVGKAGKLTIYLDSTEAFNGKRVPLSGTLTRKGEDKILFSVILSVLFSPLSPIFLTMTGTEAQLPAGYQMNARIDKDVILSVSGY